MITIKKISGSQAAAEYYAKYAQEKGEAQGYWIDNSGQLVAGAAHVDPQAMLYMLKGYSPDGKAALCQNPGEDHHPGWDLTFSPPKSVSIAWSNASDDLRIDIELAHREAVARALGFINDEATCVRVGKGGAGVEQARMVAALFQHSSNRAEEPQLHTHAIVFNVAQTKSDGKWRTLHPYPIYRAYMAAGAIYKAEMADRMKALGFETHRTK
ncbi:MAG: relaxase domain-containing protein, partial [Verrucomicrobia bacterium]|nr:relaxase domain-containing protein [Verrucomicrobiota bacterium]